MYPVSKNRYLRRALIGLLIFACISLAALFLYLRALPEITVVNRSGYVIEGAAIELPSSRVVFDAIAPGEESTIFYALSQADGVYSYAVRFSFDSHVTGECGDVTSAEFGKRLALIVDSSRSVECREGWSLF